MTRPRKTGTAVPMGQTSDPVRRALDGRLGASNLDERAVGFGEIRHGEPAGKLDAVWATVNLAGATSFDIAHTLGRRPSSITMEHWENSSGAVSHVLFAPEAPNSWTPTTARGNVHLISGSLADLVIHLLVK